MPWRRWVRLFVVVQIKCFNWQAGVFKCLKCFFFRFLFFIHDGAKGVEVTFFNSRPPRRCRYPRSFQAGGYRDSRWFLRTLPRRLPLVLYAKLGTSTPSVYGAVTHNCGYSLILFFLGNPDAKLETGFWRLVDDSIMRPSVKLYFLWNSLLRCEQAANSRDAKSKIQTWSFFWIKNEKFVSLRRV
jgi:hypothetical protein